MKETKSIIACFIMALFLMSSCATYKSPNIEVPNSQEEQTTQQTKDQNVKPLTFENDTWWTIFQDEALNSLEQEAIKYNHDLKQAMSRMSQAKSKLTIARSSYYPTLDLFGQVTDSNFNRQMKDSGIDVFKFVAGVSASYEINLWGQYFKNAQSAKTDYLSSKVDKDAVKLVLTSQVAQTYFMMLALDSQLQIGQETLKIREDSFNVYSSRFKKGVINELDLRRVEAEMETVRAQVYSIEAQLKIIESSLSILVGKSPKAIAENNLQRGKQIKDIAVSCYIPEQVPSDLLMRRPDIKAMDYKLESINAQVSAVKANMFPIISLTGAAGFASAELEDLFKKDNDYWTYDGTLTIPIFYGGKKYKNFKLAKAQYEEMTEEYQKTVQTAFKETLDAINNFSFNKKSLEACKKEVNALQISYRLAIKRQKAGLTDLLDVLDVQRMLLQAQMNYVDIQKNQLFSIVDVCKALGGGWKEKE